MIYLALLVDVGSDDGDCEATMLQVLVGTVKKEPLTQYPELILPVMLNVVVAMDDIGHSTIN